MSENLSTETTGTLLSCQLLGASPPLLIYHRMITIKQTKIIEKSCNILLFTLTVVNITQG